MSRTRILISLAVGLSWLAATAVGQTVHDPPDPSPVLHSVHVGSHLDLGDAQQQRADLEALGFSPVAIQEDEVWNRVFVGSFDVAAEAHLLRATLLDRGLAADARVVESPNDEQAPATASLLTESYLLPEGVAAVGTAGDSLADDPVYQRLETLRQAGDIAAYQDALLEEQQGRSASDPLSGHILTRLGHIALDSGDRDEARQMFAQVADGQMAADADSRADARLRMAYFTWRDGDRDEALDRFLSVVGDEEAINADLRGEALARAARMLHSQGDRMGALRAHREFTEFASSEGARSEALVECVGLIMELALHEGIGNMDDARRAACRAFAQIQPTSPLQVKRRSTIELMFMETFMHEGDLENAIRLGEEFISTYGTLGEETPVREVAAAMYMTGNNHLAADNSLAAQQLFVRILEEI